MNHKENNLEPQEGTSNNKYRPQNGIDKLEDIEIVTDEEVMSDANAAVPKPKKTNREKFDSGLGEEIAEAPSTSNGTSSSNGSSDSDDRMELREEERGSKRGSNADAAGTKWRRVTLSPNRCISRSSEEFEATHDESSSSREEIRVIQSPYTEHMKRKIQELPLPSILKKYLNFGREF